MIVEDKMKKLEESLEYSGSLRFVARCPHENCNKKFACGVEHFAPAPYAIAPGDKDDLLRKIRTAKRACLAALNNHIKEAHK